MSLNSREQYQNQIKLKREETKEKMR